MKDINHPYIIKLYDVKIDSNFIYIITEYCNGGNLKEFLEKNLEVNHKALSEEIVQYLMRQIIDAFRYLRNKKIIYRNLKLNHLLINYEDEYDRENNNILKSRIKINNFLFAKLLKKGDSAKEILGIPLTMSPILLNKLFHNKDYEEAGYDEKEDIWSLGIICYQLLVGEHPFNSDNLNELIKKVNIGGYSMPITLSKEAISFIISMLKFDSQKRISVNELYNHEFLRKNVKEFNKLNL